MKFGSATKFLIAIAILCLSVTALSCSNNNASTYIPSNEGVVNSKDFCVSSNTTALKTSARGTIFVEKDKSNNYKAQIVAWVEIDPMDWGGVSFTIPFGWEVTSRTSSYLNSSNNITMWETSDREFSKWHQMVEIGTSRDYIPQGGGSGSVIIELAANPQGQEPSEALAIMVGVGSDESNETIEMAEVTENRSDGVYVNVTQEHYKILYPDFEVIEVPIIQQ